MGDFGSLDAVFSGWAKGVLSENFLIIWCAVIVLYAFVCLVWLLRSAIPVSGALKRATGALNDYPGEQDFADGFQRYRDVVEREDLLRQPWGEFLESLVYPDAGSEEPVKNTADPGVYLSDAAIVAPRFHARFFNSVPSHLTAFGILGTFLGLAAGVGMAARGLTAADPNEVKDALRTLLDGASLAFITSIFGLFFSLVFLVVERYQASHLHRRRQAWVSGLEARLRLVTLEDLGLKQLREAQEQSKQLKSFNTDLRLALEEALEEKVGGRLAPLLEKLIEGTEGLRQDRATDSTKLIETMIGDFTKSMNDRTSAEFGAVTAALEDAAATLRTASETVSSDLGQAGKNASTEIAASLEAFRQGMERLDATSQSMAESVKVAVGEISETLRNSTENASNQLVQAGQGVSAGITSSLEGFQRGMDRLDGASKTVQSVLEEVQLSAEEMASVRQTIEESHRHLQTSLGAAKELADSVRQSSSEFRAVWSGARDVVHEASETAKAMREEQERMSAAWKNYHERFGDIDVSLSRAFQQMNEALDRYTQKTLDFGKALDEHTGNAINNLGSVAGELNETLADLEDVLSRRPINA